MSQPSVASFFNTRKRPANDDINLTKNKYSAPISNSTATTKNTVTNDDNQTMLKGVSTRSGRTIRRSCGQTIKAFKDKDDVVAEKVAEGAKPKLVEFIKKGNLSPQKKFTPPKNVVIAFTSKESLTNSGKNEIMLKTKPSMETTTKEKLVNLVKKELSFDEVKTQVTRSGKLNELKASLSRLQELEKKRKTQEQKNNQLRNQDVQLSGKTKSGMNLKEFNTIELEVLTSPTKGLSTPKKSVPGAPDKNDGLMSPKRTATPKRLLFSPSKDGSPSKLITPPAYQRFAHLTESTKSTFFPLPYKYRFLLEVFRCLDSVVAMYFNRKENITFKKLKPAVQRMLRRNFYESHLAQIKHLYPDAFHFHQIKMRNYGSISKEDYFQLVITPNVDTVNGQKLVKIDEDNILKSGQNSAMNPQVMVERQQKLHDILLDKVYEEHETFLKSLDKPIETSKSKITRWHPAFDLNNCPEIELAPLPQPPNIEKFSSAKEILSTARNLFNCSTSLERAMNRYEANVAAAAPKEELDEIQGKSQVKEPPIPASPMDNFLKGVPQSLLEKIRAKEAAKALEEMTRRPSQDQEAIKFSRLPELARHLRNVFITEKKGVLPLEVVIKKIENSFRTNLTHKDIEKHLQMIAKECPEWVAFHDVRNTIYLKLTRDLDMKKIIQTLENAANAKSK